MERGLLKSFIVVLLLFIGKFAYATDPPVFYNTPLISDSILGTSINTPGANAIVRADFFPSSAPTDLTWHSNYRVLKSDARAVLKLNGTEASCTAVNFTCTVRVELTYYKWDNSQLSLETDLIVSYDKTNGIKYNEKGIYRISDAYYLKVLVLSVSNSALAQYLRIDAEIEQERYRPFNTSYIPNINNISIDNTANEITVELNVASVDSFASEYDLEYTFIEAYNSSGGIKAPNATDIDMRFNATRVTLKNTIYKLSNNYEKGYFICRVRAVGKDYTTISGKNYIRRIEGDWSVVGSSGKAGSSGTSPSSNGYIAYGVYGIVTPHLASFNWQYLSSFAEDAKKKEIITYYDGSLRSRQVVSKSFNVKSDSSYVIIQDKIYDYQGRLAIEVLPAPVDSEALKYYPNTSMNLDGTPHEFTRIDFDTDDVAKSCGCTTEAMNDLYGASKYYSTNNSFVRTSQTEFQNYTPTAGGFPFIQTEFTPDNTGRISRKSAPGLNHQLDSTHETKYEYVRPNQPELDRLFGSEIGFAEHYKKNIVTDANGQISVSYLNAKGQVVATALAGKEPTSLSQLSSYDNSSPIYVNLMNVSDTLYSKESLINAYSFYVYEESDYKFMYSVTGLSFDSAGCVTAGYCSDCTYDLEISITNKCNLEQLYGEGVGQAKTLIKRKIGDTTDYNTCEDTIPSYSFSQDQLFSADANGYITVHLQPGMYTIFKKLSVNQDDLNYYLDKYVLDVNCKTLEDFQNDADAAIDLSGCGITCEECNARIGINASRSNIDSAFTAYKNKKKEEYTELGKAFTASDSMVVVSSFNDLKSICDEICEPNPNMCYVIKEILKNDLSPGQQYAKFKKDTDSSFIADDASGSDNYNILGEITGNNMSYMNVTSFPEFADTNLYYVIINNVKKPIKDLTVNQFVINFKSEWTDILVREHPEYCRYEDCVEDQDSRDYDMAMMSTEDYASASSNNYLDPLYDNSGTIISRDPYFNSGCGATYKSGDTVDMWSRFNSYKKDSGTYDYSMKDLVVMLLFCPDTLKNHPGLLYNCVQTYRDSVATACDAIKDRYWSTLKALYQANKNYLYSLCECSDTIPGGRERRIYPKNYDGNELYKASGSPLDPRTNDFTSQVTTMQTSMNNSIASACSDQCNSYADYWMIKLKGCNLNSYDSLKVRDTLIAVCKRGCDVTNPMGSSTVAPKYLAGGANASETQFKSFNDVLKNVLDSGGIDGNIYVAGICDDILIKAPMPYGHDYLSYESAMADTCQCENDTINCPCTQTNLPGGGLKSLLVGTDVADSLKCKTCITCVEFRNAYDSFYQRYYTISEDTSLYDGLFTTFINNYLNFNLDLDDYKEFAANCIGEDTFNSSTWADFRTFYRIEQGVYWGSINGIEFWNPGIIDERYLIATTEQPPTVSHLDKTTSLSAFNMDHPITWYSSMVQSPSYKSWLKSASKVSYSNRESDKSNIDQTATTSIEKQSGLRVNSDPFSINFYNKYYTPGLLGINGIQKVNKVASTLGDEPDTCACNKMFAAYYEYLSDTTAYSSDQDAFESMNGMGSGSFTDYVDIFEMCCRAFKGDPAMNTSDLPSNNSGATRCTPDGWNSSSTWNSTQTGLLTTSNSNIPDTSPDGVVMPDDPPLNCDPPSGDTILTDRQVLLDDCACNKIMKSKAEFDDGAGDPGESFEDYFTRTHYGIVITGLASLDSLCRSVFAEADDDENNQDQTWTPDAAWSSNSIMNLAILAETKGISVPADLCDPQVTGGDTIVVPLVYGPDCGEEKAVIDSILAANDVTLAQAMSNSTILQAIANALNAHYPWKGYTQTSLSDMYDGTYSKCCWKYGDDILNWPEGAECYPNWGMPPPKSGPGVVSQCDTCYMPSDKLYLLQTYFNKLLAPKGNFGVKYLSSNGWNMYNHSYTSYYNTSLYGGTNDTDLIYTVALGQNAFGNGKTLSMAMNDGLDATSATLEIFGPKVWTNMLFIDTLFGIRLIDAIDCTHRYFAINGVFEYNNEVDTLVLIGSVIDIDIVTAKNCAIKDLRLCNRPATKQLSIDPCGTDLAYVSQLNAQNNYNRYIDSLRNNFRTRYIQKCMQARNTEQFRMKYSNGEYHYTLYYYDQAGNLTKTIPPKGVQIISDTNDLNDARLARETYNAGSPATAVIPSHTLATHYQYNTLNQLIWQSTPDAGISQFYYDELGRIVFSQNSKQVTVSNTYSYTRYDKLGRITEVGEVYSASYSLDHTKSRRQTFADTMYAATRTEIVKTLYDVVDPDMNAQFEQNNIRNRVSSSGYYANSSATDPEHGSYYDYDIHGNVKALARRITALEEIAQGLKITQYDYDLISGKVNRVIYQEGEADQYLHVYQYDEENRLTLVKSGPRYELLETDAYYQYYLHGPLARMELGNIVQGVDYAYTIQGWLKGVNSGTLKSNRDIGRDGELGLHQNVAKDAYGFILDYFNGDYTPVNNATSSGVSIYKAFMPGFDASSNAGNASRDLYNGNIKMMTTAIGKFMELGVTPLATVYSYDQLNRIRNATYFNNIDTVENKWKTGGASLASYYNHFVYDANGNIINQIRRGLSSTNIKLDSLEYVYYSNSNKLRKVIDDPTTSRNYLDDIDNQPDDNYTYDAIGNLTKDVSEEIGSISWTVYGKIKKITRVAGSSKPTIEYEYTSDGHRSVKIVTPTTGLKNYTFYVRDAQGNIMGTYNRGYSDLGSGNYKDTFALNEWMMYGSSILGINASKIKLVDREISATYSNGAFSSITQNSVTSYDLVNDSFNLTKGNKQYQLNNHLGNVMVVVSDKRISYCQSDTISFYLPDVLSATDYSPFGAPLPGRTLTYTNLKCLKCTDLQTTYNDYVTANGALLLQDMTAFASYANTQLNINSEAEEYLAELKKCKLIQGALAFNGSSTKVMSDNNVNFNLGNQDVTVEGWIYLNSSSGGYRMILENVKVDNGKVRGLQLFVYNDKVYFAAFDGGTSGSAHVGTTSSIPLNQWVHIAATKYHGGSISYAIYINGSSVSLNTYNTDAPDGTGMTISEQVSIGYSKIGNSDYLDGYIRNVRIYNRQLSSTEVSANYNSGCISEPANHEGLIYNIRLDNASGSSVSDLINQSQSTISNGTWELKTLPGSGCISALELDQVILCKEGDYRFGFNGKELDNEVKGSGNEYDFGDRIYDPRLGKWISLDSRFKSYPDYSPYNYSLNSPIMLGDPNGQWVEKKTTRFKIVNGEKVQLKGIFSIFVKADVIEISLIVHQAKIIDLSNSLTPQQIDEAAKTIQSDITEKWTTSTNKDLKADKDGYVINSRGQKIKAITTFGEPITVAQGKQDVLRGDNVFAIVKTDDPRIKDANASVPGIGGGIMYIDKNEITQQSLPAHEFGHWGHLGDLLFGSEENIMYNKPDRKDNNFPELNEYIKISGSQGVTNTRTVDLNQSK